MPWFLERPNRLKPGLRVVDQVQVNFYTYKLGALVISNSLVSPKARCFGLMPMSNGQCPTAEGSQGQ